MAGTITLALQSARSGLLASQAALGTIAENVSNVNTPGYSRKIVNLEQRVVAGTGAGVQIGEVSRAVDEGLMKDLREEDSDLNKLSVQNPFYERVQEIFGAPGDNSSIVHTIAKLTAAVESLAVTPNRSLEQAEVVRWAQNVADQLNDMSVTIQDLRKQTDDDITQLISEANNHLQEIEDLNNKIVRNQTVSNDVTDLKDKRDIALNELSKLIDIQYFVRTEGEVAVFTRSGRALVDDTAQGMTHTPASGVSATTTHAEGDFSGIYVGLSTTSNDITNDVISGKLKGLIDLRDNTLQDLQAQIDELASELRDNINQVHNKGVAFPGNTSLSGSTRFIDPANQTMKLAANQDVRIVIFDSSGNQQFQTNLDSILVDAQAATTLETVASSIQTWLQGTAGLTSATASFNSSNQLVIDLGTSSSFIAFRDEGTQTANPPHSDVSISFDKNADGTTDETVSGFCNFFGLNDLFVDELNTNIYDSSILNKDSFSASAATLKFYDTTTGTAATMGGTSISIQTGDSLSTIAERINFASIGVTATVVPEGDGHRLRITHDGGDNLVITDATGGSLLSNLGLHESTIRTSANLKVRDDIVAAPSLISRGEVLYDDALGVGGEYYVSSGDNSIISSIASTLSGTNSFDKAGGLDTLTQSFTDFAGSILSYTSSKAANNEADSEVQSRLVDNLQNRSDTLKGVNLDEELSNMILYEQAYSAAARVISVISQMFDTLEAAVQ